MNKIIDANSKLPWKSLGKDPGSAFTAEEVITSCGLNFTVELAPIYAKLPSIDGKNRGKIVSKAYATYRTDTEDTFAVVGSKYEVCQNTKAFEFFDSIVGAGKAKYETAGALRDGASTFLTAKLPSSISIKGEDINNYLLFTNSHDGSKAITVMFTPIRVVCENTLAMALSNKAGNRIDIRHTASLHDRLEEANRVLGIVQTTSEQYNAIYNKMTTVKLTDKEVDLFINNIFLSREELTSIERGIPYEKVLSTRKSNVLNGIKNFAFTGIGQDTLATKGTLFGAFSAVTGYFTNGKTYISEDTKMESLYMGGTDYKLAQKAFDKALTLLT